MKPSLSARALLSDFICTPVAMRADRFFALVADLAAGRSPQEERYHRALRAEGGESPEREPEEREPWEEPLYSLDLAGTARLTINGPLVKGYDAFTCWYWGLMSTDRLQAALLELAASSAVRRVRVVINSPGGMSAGMPETADLLVALSTQKEVVGFTSDLAASNGYRLLAACDVAVATRSATVGCIGTYIALYDYSEYLAELGIKLELFRAGDLKGIGLPGKALTEGERAFLQSSVDRSNAAFTGFVTARRGAVDVATMQGQWFDGDEALALNLIDAVVTTEAELAALTESDAPAPAAAAIAPARPAPRAAAPAAAAAAAAPAASALPPITVNVTLPPMSFAGAPVHVAVDNRHEKDSIRIEQSQQAGGAAKKIERDAQGRPIGLVDAPAA